MCRVCIWTALLLFLLAIFNACTIISKFTRIAGELFGMLIAVLFIQQAVKVCAWVEVNQKWRIVFFNANEGDILDDLKYRVIHSQGVISEYKIPEAEDATAEKYQFPWLYTNGLLGIIFSFGLLFTSLKSRRARSWRYGTGLWSDFMRIFAATISFERWTFYR